jgi:hypothetical protein
MGNSMADEKNGCWLKLSVIDNQVMPGGMQLFRFSKGEPGWKP